MFKTYFKSVFQFLRKNSLFTLINTMGLSLALAVSFLIVLYVVNELSYDNYHKNKSRIFRVIAYDTEFKSTMAGTPYVLTATIKEDFPQVEKATQTRYLRGFKLKCNDEYFDVWSAVGTSSDIFDIFTIPLIYNQTDSTLLDDPHAIVLSRHLSDKVFPGQNPVGKEIEGIINGEPTVFTISAVFENLPENSTLVADCFVNGKWTLGPIDKSFNTNNAETNWNYDFWNTWVLLSNANQANDLNQQFRDFEKKHISENPVKNYSLQKLRDVYLRSANIMNTGRSGDLKTIKLFSLIAFLILLIAAMNYILLSTAVSTLRTKGIGIRKASGASNKNVRIQLLVESILLSFVSLPIATGLALLARHKAGELFQTNLQLIPSNIFAYVIIFLTISILIGLASGGYTATYLSRLKVINILKDKNRQGKRKHYFQSALIITELIIFSTFVSSALVVQAQYRFFMTKDPGYNTKSVLLIDVGRGFNAYTPYLNTLKSNPNIIMAAGVMEGVPMRGSMFTMVPNYQEPENKVKVEGLACDYNFLKTMGMKFVEGRDFSESFGNDLNGSVILNETAVKRLGIEHPIGKQFGDQTIIGVVKDFNLHSLESDIPPLFINLTDRYIRQIAVQYKPGTFPEVLSFLKSEWGKVADDRPFGYSTIEEINQSIYRSEKNLSTIVSLSAFFTLIISMFGLFGLTLFITKSRTKEIGIRKVMGSSEKSIIYSFLRTNMVSVVLATVISVPVTFYLMLQWLNNYAYHTKINFWVFAFTLGIAMILVVFTVLFLTMKAARTNPVEALRYE